MLKIKFHPEKLVVARFADFRVIRYMTAGEGSVGVTLVVRNPGLNLSTCFDIFRTLVNKGIVKEIAPLAVDVKALADRVNWALTGVFSHVAFR